ncbi:MAG TPA: cupin domain-containing protein [Candidatus Aminicenantes bacterium]|nr:cupin domain-containing protein [Candidatus Aminicenantes bacterium]
MKITKPSEITPLYEEGGVTGRRISARPGVEIIHMSLEPGAVLAPHTTPFDAQFFSHQGTAVFMVGDGEITAAQGTLLDCPGSTPHGIRNDTEAAIAVLVIKYLRT